MTYYIDGRKATEAEATAQEEKNRQLLNGDPKFWDQIKWIFAEDVLTALEAERRAKT